MHMLGKKSIFFCRVGGNNKIILEGLYIVACHLSEGSHFGGVRTCGGLMCKWSSHNASDASTKSVTLPNTRPSSTPYAHNTRLNNYWGWAATIFCSKSSFPWREELESSRIPNSLCFSTWELGSVPKQWTEYPSAKAEGTGDSRRFQVYSSLKTWVAAKYCRGPPSGMI